MSIMRHLLLAAGILSAVSLPAQTQTTLRVDAAKKIAAVSPTLYGLMTEEINYSYDGGLYAEMVRNRAFHKNWLGHDAWTVVARGDSRISVSGVSDGPSTALHTSLELRVQQASHSSPAGLANAGYWGMAVKPSTMYRGSFYAKTNGVGPAEIQLINNSTGEVAAQASVATTDGGWKKYDYTLRTSAEVPAGAENHLEITFSHPGTAQLQLISLFPPTFHQRPNGNREDLMRMMQAMKPKFLRLPGGNYLEGDTFEERFNWKETVGPLVDRPTHRSPWRYQSSDGMGLLEFLEWCEDLKVEPVLAVFAGYSLKGEYATGKNLEPFIQDALDEIEYVAGDVHTKWGAVRARDGHPEPFTLHYIEIGNEDQYDKSKSYDSRFEQMATAIRAKYPQYKLIATMPVSRGNPDVIDDHYYKLPDEFFAMAHRYDAMSRKGPKIFVGEWATRTGSPTPDFGAALGDAAWMTGMERNSDLIVMASYAPLFTNVNPGGMQWSSDLIGYTADKAYGSPSYWAQVLFANHLGDHVVQSSAEGAGERFFWSATASATTLYLKLVNASDIPVALHLELPGVKTGTATRYALHAATRFATNSIDHPDAIKPVKSTVQVSSSMRGYLLPANTIQVLEIALEKK